MSMVEETGADGSATPSHMSFHGTLSLHVPPEYAGRIRTGYAAFRSKTRPTLFGDDTWNLELYSHLRVRVAYRGWEGWRSKFVCNLQTDGPVR
jgi:NADH dehydrogenase [ubiquinone] 1 alpha subcomplex assembly factor 1